MGNGAYRSWVIGSAEACAELDMGGASEKQDDAVARHVPP